ncbi:MAG: helix-hairpin-helix domain-containing protein [Saprospiraceae bacterium]
MNKDFNFHKFDPNTVSESELLSMGFSNFIVGNMIKYREKGGRFYKSEDMKRIYGISDSDYEAMKDYILISEINNEKKYSSA